MENYIEQFIALVNGVKLTALMMLIVANFLTGLAVSVETGTFRLKELGDLMRSRVVPYLLGYLAVGLVAVIDPTWRVLVPVVWGAVLLTLAGAILQNLKELGLKLPDFLGGSSDKE